MSVKHNLEQWISEIDSDGMCDISDNQVIALIRGYNSMAVQLANAESKCRELAGLVAENAVMKEFLHSRVDESICDKHVKTPVTDAFLAEVRAQGVEMAACALDDVNQFNYANMLDDLAQQIRKVVAQ